MPRCPEADLLYALLVVRTKACSRWERDEAAARAQWATVERYLIEGEGDEALGAWERGSRVDFEAAIDRITARLLESIDAP